MKNSNASEQRSATSESLPRFSSADLPAFSVRLIRIAALLQDEADFALNGRLAQFFRQDAERLREIARIGARS